MQSTHVGIILRLQDKVHEGKQLNDITIQMTPHPLFNLACLASAGLISADHQALRVAT